MLPREWKSKTDKVSFEFRMPSKSRECFDIPKIWFSWMLRALSFFQVNTQFLDHVRTEKRKKMMIFFDEWNTIIGVWNIAVVMCFFSYVYELALVHGKINILSRHSKHQSQLLTQGLPAKHKQSTQAHQEDNSLFTVTSPESVDTMCFHKSLFQLLISFLEDYCHWARCCQGQSKSKVAFWTAKLYWRAC